MQFNIYKSGLKIAVLRGAASIGGAFGRNCLTRGQTSDLLADYGVNLKPGDPLRLQTVGGLKSIEIRPSGTVRLNSRDILHLDFGNRWALFDNPRKTVHIDKAIALWSHKFLGYYHWIVDVLPKICRLMNHLGEDFHQYKLCYPRINQPYESESLAILGIDENNVIDTGKCVNIKTCDLLAVPAPNWHSGSPNITSLRDYFVTDTTDLPVRRLYLSRSSGRRRICVNDKEVFDTLESLGFEYVEEKRRSLTSQIELFSQAAIVVSPHGGSMTNMVWSPIGSLWIELAESSYYPPFYRGLAASCSLRYDAVLSNTGPHHKANVVNDLKVNIRQMAIVISKYI